MQIFGSKISTQIILLVFLFQLVFFYLQEEDFSPQREPVKSHYFLAGVGLVHIFVCTFFTFTIILIRYAIPGTNIFEVKIAR